MFGRRRAQAHSRLMQAELGQGFEHFRMAAAHAASGTADYVSPKVATAKRKAQPGVRTARKASAATFGPIAAGSLSMARTARKSANKGKAKLTRKEPQVRRWPTILGGLLAAGAAIGATGAIIARRRANRSQWEEYGTTHTTSSRGDSMIDSARSSVESGKEKVQSLAESAKERASDMMSSSSSSTASPTTSSPSSSSYPSSASSTTGTSSTGSGSVHSTGGSSEFGTRDDIYGRTGSSNNSRS
jgi:hypothetical protein